MTDSTSAPIRIVIVGAVAGGASAAARARRLDEHADITLIERGPDVSFANCGLPYHIGGEITDRSKLALQTPDSLRNLLNLSVLAETEAVSINRDAKTVSIRNLKDGTKSELPYDKLILSPGASPLTPPLEGINLPGIYTLRNLQDMDRIKAAATGAHKVLVIGAGFIGLEMAEQLVHLKKEVTLVELVEQVLPQMDAEMVRPVEQELLDHHVNLVLGDGINGFEATENGLRATLNSGKLLEADMVILSIGVRPESALAKDAGLDLGARGHIKSNAHMQTSDPDIYAVGDVCEGIDPILGGPSAVPLGGPANRQGRCAADHILLGDEARPYPGSIGTAIVRVFDIAAGVTGHSEKRLQQLGVAYQKTIVTDYNHASYYPGATHLSVKLLWETESGRILGGQVTGIEGVDKRLDVLATAIKGKLTVDDLEHMELAYAPPFGSAKDPLNTAGFSANNMRNGQYTPVYDLPTDGSVQLVDVRPSEMASLNPVAGSVNIPYPQMRTRMHELDKSKPVITFCMVGKTSYFASRILKQNGFDVKSHVGGMKIEKRPSAPEKKSPEPVTETSDLNKKKLDACGLACPGPILKVKEALKDLAPGQELEILSSDSGFKNDLPAFCAANGVEFISAVKENGLVKGLLRKPLNPVCPTAASTASSQDATMVVFSGELDKAMAALVIANGALAMGGKATLFFTFWGLNVLRKDHPPVIEDKSFMDKMFGWMLPRGVHKLPLSNMHMAGMGTKMMKDRMRKKDLPNLPGLLESAVDSGARLVACTMSMEAMGIREEELIDGIELGGVAEFLGASSQSGTNLFI
jgi:NADPH-dependent 2,4-dienoyl-CoA reductase/sulfur reductase-like enzyme/peroxiredoxin family protein/TusA-related sulfurtransferase/rhodanese-related sulfurtransferase